MSPNDAGGMANSVDPDQTAPLGSALFAHAYLSETLGSLRYTVFQNVLVHCVIPYIHVSYYVISYKENKI